MRLTVPIVCSLILCSPSLCVSEAHSDMAEPETRIDEVLEQNRDAIMALPGVIGTGISRCGDELCIMVLVSRDCPDVRNRLEEILGSHPYAIEETEPIRALPADPE